MHKGYDIGENGMAVARHDDRSRDDVKLEIVRALAGRERHSLSANLIGVAVCGSAALALPYGEMLILPLLLRLAAMGGTRMLSNRLRANLQAHVVPHRDLRRVAASLGFAGVTWALLLWPLIHNAPQLTTTYAPAMAIVGVTIVAVSLIASMLGTVPHILAIFITCFLVTLTAGALLSPDPVSPWAVTGVIGITCGMVAFSLGSARDIRRSAETLVENRRLGEELAEALAQAEFLSLRDPLTGLLNRRAFFEDKGSAGPGHVLAIDLDHFKRVNDGFGHAAGDRVLVAAAAVLRDAARSLPGDGHRAARLGGEEFALQLTGINRAAALVTADELRRGIATVAKEIGLPGLIVSASIGVAAYASPEDLDAALQRADEALYCAKAAGRDTVIQAAA